MTEIEAVDRKPITGWEMVLVAAAVVAALALGFANLGAPSLWHDEAVQVLVAKNIAETGHAVLPSGKPHPVAPLILETEEDIRRNRAARARRSASGSSGA